LDKALAAEYAALAEALMLACSKEVNKLGVGTSINSLKSSTPEIPPTITGVLVVSTVFGLVANPLQIRK